MEKDSVKAKPIKILEAVVKDDKKLKVIIIFGLVLIGFLFITSLFPKSISKNNSPLAVSQITMEEYAENIETRVLTMIRTMRGVGNAEVMVTLENGKETIYQSNTKEQSDKQGNDETGKSTNENIEQEVVLIDGGSGTKQALVKTEKAPTVSGVIIVCDGASDIQVKAQIIDAVKAAFGINSARIAVVQRS